MPQSTAEIYLHLVFSTKERRPFLQNRSIREELHRFLGGCCNKLECPVMRVGGVADHVQILCRFGKSIQVSELVKELKRQSSIWLKTKSNDLRDFHWQSGYGIFSISPGHMRQLIIYINNQEEHHRKESFQDELRRIMKKYGVKWDEDYVWD